MNNESRQVFWDRLCSLDGHDVTADFKKLKETIEYPTYLYRYRPINDYSLDNLRTNTLFFSSADKFDDPFDTYIHVDKAEIERKVKEFLSNNENIHILKSLYKELYGTDISSNTIEQIESCGAECVINMFNAFSKDMRTNLQQMIRVSCFSEELHNRALWLKYGDSHRGFCLIYDTLNSDNFLCGKEEKCSNCKSNIPTPLYPVYYSNDKLDAAQFVEHVFGLILLKHLPESKSDRIEHFINTIVNIYSNNIWWNTKVSLVKEYSHNQDKEWRMVVNDTSSSVFITKWRPTGIVIGLRTSDTNKAIIKALAKEAGIQHIYQTIINDNDELDSVEIE